MKGHFFSLSRLIDSSVWGSRPCMMSTTRMAMSHRELPRFLKLLNGNTTTDLERLPDRLAFEQSSSRFAGVLPEGFVSWGVDDQHAGNL